MPLYDYECRSCGSRFELLISAARADDVACEGCGATEVRRLLPVIAGLGGRAEAPSTPCGGSPCGQACPV
ncbi:MAG: zinc ribbon domain-containing protein [Actinomycetota bacterium]